ncbi:MAG TPA: NAD(P)-dependent oxidoreductase, partial [Leucothrix sp.]|nr:NAD(P)-dependent oxidoreductase [Leucothrix sp.]
MKKVLITGGNGQLGYELQRTIPRTPKTPDGYTCISSDVADLDITNADAIKAYVADIKPDIIINSAAYTAVDKAEEEKELAIAINTTGAANLAQVCKDNGIRLMQVSTDFVFDGKACSPYPVDAPTEPDGYYGLTKRDGDLRV